MRMSALILCYCEATTYSDGGAENDGHKNDGPSKLQISVDRRSRPMHVRWATLCLVSILWGCYISLYHKLLICWIWASYSKNKKVLSAVLLRENTIVLQNGDGNWCYEHNPSYLATIWSKANYRAKLLTVSVVVTGVQSLGGENQNVSTQVDCTFTKKLAVTDWTVCSHQNRLQSTPNFVRLLSCTVKHTETFQLRIHQQRIHLSCYKTSIQRWCLQDDTHCLGWHRCCVHPFADVHFTIPPVLEKTCAATQKNIKRHISVWILIFEKRATYV